MNESSQRVEEFRAELGAMNIADPAAGREKLLLGLGSILLVVGPVLGIVGYFISHGTTNSLQQRDGIVLALIGVALAVAGAALFLRYSIANFLRFWLTRLVYEQRAQTDRIVGGAEDPPAN